MIVIPYTQGRGDRLHVSNSIAAIKKYKKTVLVFFKKLAGILLTFPGTTTQIKPTISSLLL